jgi:hypothetical protein
MVSIWHFKKQNARKITHDIIHFGNIPPNTLKIFATIFTKYFF